MKLQEAGEHLFQLRHMLAFNCFLLKDFNLGYIMPRPKQVDKQKILNVSIAIVNQEGLNALSLASVAQKLGIAIPSLYNHISSLDGLRYELSVWGIQALREAILLAVIGKAGDEAILSMATAYRAFAHEQSGVYRATLRAPKDGEADLGKVTADLLAIVSAIFAAYGLSEADNIHAIRSFRSLVHGFVDLELSGGFGIDLSLDESFARLIQLYLNGLNMRKDV